MFTQVESDYLKSLINFYKKQGYDYYLAHTVTENYNNYDMCIYFSKEEIEASTDNTFNIKNAIVINIDSSSRNDNNNTSVHSRDIIVNSNYSGSLLVHSAEFIYTNAILGYTETSFCINPDILESGVSSYKLDLSSYIIIFLLVLILLYHYLHDLIKIHR